MGQIGVTVVAVVLGHPGLSLVFLLHNPTVY